MVNSACPLWETNEPDPDRRIAAEVINGNPQAYNQLVERYWGRIFARAHALLGNRQDAEEVTQDAFARAFESLPRFRWEASFPTWLYQIASNLARNRYWYWRRRSRTRAHSLEAPLGDDGLCLHDVVGDGQADPGDRLRWDEFHRAVETHLGRLPGSHRQVMEMRLLDNLSYEEISATLDIPVGTVKSRIARARRQLARSLGLDAAPSVYLHASELARGRR